MGQSTPPVSVGVPVYRDRPFLADTIRSILTQTHQDFELVVLDNASQDGSAEIARSFDDPRIRLVRNPTTLPLVENWNRVIELTSAPLVKLMCADDLLHPRSLELQVEPMADDPGLALVASRRHMIDEDGRMLVASRGLSGLVGVRSGAEVARRVVRSASNPIGEPGCVLFRRDFFDAAGGWRGDRTHVMDLDLWMRLLRYGRFLGLPDSLFAFRLRRDSVSAANDRKIYDEQRLLIEDLRRSPYYRVRRSDLTLGRLLAPASRTRRRALFAFSNLTRSKAAAGQPG